jgi:hypothetical protein
MSLEMTERKIVELKQKLANLDAEFKYWEGLSGKGAMFEKHNSQISAIVTVLKQLHLGAHKRVADATAPVERLAVGRRAERMMLATQRIWEFFRNKFAQRKEERLLPYLAAADEFAWACYKPVQETASKHTTDVRKEPPLVFFNGGLSPYSISRDRAFEGEYVPNELLSGPEFTKVLNSLPIPVIGVPWHQVSHLPDALVIGHEVGHTIEDDFKLTAQMKQHLEEALVSVDASHHKAWKSWLGEIFADLYGCLTTGPAFVGSLMDFLARDPQEIGEEKPVGENFGKYPTTQLRMLINFAALSKIGFSEDGDKLKKDWLAFFPTHQMTGFQKDIDLIIPTLLDGSYPQLNGSLKDVFCFSADQQKEADRAKRMIMINKSLDGSSGDFRVLFAAARMAYVEDPNEFVEKKYNEMFLKRIGDAIKPGTRAGQVLPSDEEKSSLATQHETIGVNIFERLWD